MDGDRLVRTEVLNGFQALLLRKAEERTLHGLLIVPQRDVAEIRQREEHLELHPATGGGLIFLAHVLRLVNLPLSHMWDKCAKHMK